MLYRLRPIFTAAALAACIGVSLATAIAVVRQGTIASGAGQDEPTTPAGESPAVAGASNAEKPPSAPASESLRQLMVSQDLTKAPREKQLAIVTQIEQTTLAGADWRPLDQDLTPEQRRRAEENLTELLRVWFLAKADEYAVLDRAQRSAFVDSLIDNLLALVPSIANQTKLDPKSRPPAKGDARTKGNGEAAFLRLLGKWQERTTAAEWVKALPLMLALRERGQARVDKELSKLPKPKPAP